MVGRCASPPLAPPATPPGGSRVRSGRSSAAGQYSILDWVTVVFGGGAALDRGGVHNGSSGGRHIRAALEG